MRSSFLHFVPFPVILLFPLKSHKYLHLLKAVAHPSTQIQKPERIAIKAHYMPPSTLQQWHQFLLEHHKLHYMLMYWHLAPE